MNLELRLLLPSRTRLPEPPTAHSRTLKLELLGSSTSMARPGTGQGHRMVAPPRKTEDLGGEKEKQILLRIATWRVQGDMKPNVIYHSWILCSHFSGQHLLPFYSKPDFSPFIFMVICHILLYDLYCSPSLSLSFFFKVLDIESVVYWRDETFKWIFMKIDYQCSKHLRNQKSSFSKGRENSSFLRWS